MPPRTLVPKPQYKLGGTVQRVLLHEKPLSDTEVKALAADTRFKLCKDPSAKKPVHDDFMWRDRYGNELV